jgi:hypothetical protein
MGFVKRLVLAVLCAGILAAQSPILPLREVKAGMIGTGRTVFQGDRIDEFRAEILGVMENAGPRQSLILARLSGGALAETGVLQGMSGSPVYVEGKLIGAVATAFSFSKEPIAGIRPIEDMLALPTPVPQRAMQWSPDGSRLALAADRPSNAPFGQSRLTNIATPLSFSGFPAATIERFAPQFRVLGMEARQGVSAGGAGSSQMGDPAKVVPGSMISARLISGDLVLGADGTVTHVDNGNIYAFGHQFLSTGTVDIPFWRAEVISLLPSLEVSFKISTAKEFMGSLTSDYETGIRGVLGRRPDLLPVHLTVNGQQNYDLQLVRDPLLSPFLLQVATSAVIDATQRATGQATVNVQGEIRFKGGAAPVTISNTYAADTAVASSAALSGAVPLSYLMQTGFADLTPAEVRLDIHTVETKQQLTIDGLWASRSKVRPGETVEFAVELRGEGARETVERVQFRVPPGIPAGPLQITVAEAAAANLLDFAQTLSQLPHSAAQATEFLNGLRPNHEAFLRIVRPEASFPVGYRQMPDPPPSVALQLNRWPAAATLPQPQAKVAEFAIGAGLTPRAMISGTRTIQIEVVE